MFTRLPQRLPGIFATASVFLACILSSVEWTGSGGRTLAGGGCPVVMSGRFSGVGVTMFVDREVVQSWLPAGLLLHERCPYEEHPVVILLGEQRDLVRTKARSYGLMYTRKGRYYLETFVAVPYLKLKDHAYREPVFHFVRVYLNHARATRQGIRGFGWPKIHTAIRGGKHRYRVFGSCSRTILDARPDWSQVEAADPRNASLEQIRRMLSQPLVLKHHGAFDVYSFDMHFDTATVKSLPSRFQLRRGFMPRLEAVEANFPGINAADFGAFHIDCRFVKAPLNF